MPALTFVYILSTYELGGRMQANTKHQTGQLSKLRALPVAKSKSLKKNKQLAYSKYEEALGLSQEYRQWFQALSKAKQFITQAITINPIDAESLNLLSRIELELGNHLLSLEAINAALELDPDNGAYWYSSGHTHLAVHDALKAKTAFLKAIELSPGETRAEVSLAHSYTELEEPVKAFELYRQIIKNQFDDIQIRSQLLNAASTLTADYYDQQLEHDLISYLNWKDVNLSSLANLTCSLLEHKFQLNEDGSAAQFEEMANSELFQLALSHTIIKSELLEKLIIALRYELLSYSTKNGHLSHQYILLSNAIAQYGLKNEFILPLTDAEKNMVKALANLIDMSLEKVGCMPMDVSGALLLLAMYEPWITLKNYLLLSEFNNDSWPDMTFNLKLENEILFAINDTEFESITTMPSIVTDKVKAQYETYPYPRWDKLDYKKSTNYGAALTHVYPDSQFSQNLFSESLRVLIAGCGTGRHALNVAKYFNHVNVTAIDISKKSLSFANSKALELAVNNIQFKLADLTKLKALPEQYDIIECSGVLHHIPDYKTALNGLLKNLKPNGLIKISLYSEYARSSINEVRSLFSREVNQIDEQKIKIIRQAIFQGEVIKDSDGIIRSDDFYSMSGTIDLLFHQFERQFTPNDLKILCEEFQLEWLGFSNLKGCVKTAFLEFHKSNNADIKNLEQWDEFERENPNTFSAMYQFYCQYKPKLKLNR
ncbi:MAG: ubiquinone/menaquinone biosynthesis C-methylase UbiE [Psychrobacter glaciei]|jgi:ubiquinone/menaquinone biosynthesis C-methylase UbiE